MKHAILVAVFVATVHFSSACPADSPYSTKFSGDSIPTTQQLLSDITNVIGLQSNFELKEANVLNIEATISRRKRQISYNPAFINRINTLTKNKWATTALLAHEVGHHLNGHTIRKTGSKPQLELEADEFAGFVLHKLGASLEQAQEVMKYIAKPEDSPTHPARVARMLAIQKGWNKVAHTDTSLSVN